MYQPNQRTKTMKIKITPDNYRAINAALDAVNGTARSQVIRYASDVLAVVERAEAKLASLPKAERGTASVTYTPAGPMSAYKYKAKSTRISAVRGSKCWYLISVETVDLYPTQKERFAVTITAGQAQRITEITLSDYIVAKDQNHDLL